MTLKQISHSPWVNRYSLSSFFMTDPWYNGVRSRDAGDIAESRATGGLRRDLLELAVRRFSLKQRAHRYTALYTQMLTAPTAIKLKKLP